MSIFGAMQSGISALASQSSSMGAISDNIANVNTVGYKSNSVAFSTLVTKQSSSSLYSPGGVQSKPKQSISAQGLLSATSNSTDVAISGSGYFVVNQSANPGEGDLWAYTRAGSFSVDENGYLKNTGGYYAQAWSLLPWDGNPNATVVDVNGIKYMKAYYDASGNTVYINDNIIDGTNLRPVNLANIGGTATPTHQISLGANLPSDDPIYDPTNAAAGGKRKVSALIYDSLGNASNMSLEYTKTSSNGWSMGASVPSGASSVTLYGGRETTGDTSQDVYYAAGQLEFTKIPENGSSIAITDAGTGTTYNFIFTNGTATIPPDAGNTKNIAVDISAGIITTSDFTKAFETAIKNNMPSANRFTADGSTIQIVQSVAGAELTIDASKTLACVQSASNPAQDTGIPTGVFTIQAIDNDIKNTARIDFNSDKAADYLNKTIVLDGKTYHFVNTDTADDPDAGDYYVNIADAISGGDVDVAKMMSIFGAKLNTTATEPSRFVISGSSLEILPSSTGGDITIDTTGLGTAISGVVRDSVTNSWKSIQNTTATLANQFTVNGTEVEQGAVVPAVRFNADGTPKYFYVDEMAIEWANGAQNMDGDPDNGTRITLDMGNVGTNDGLTNLSGDFLTNYINQDGAKFGSYTGVSISEDGVVTALFDNGETRPIAILPLATFANANGMEALTGNTWIETDASGQAMLRQAGTNGAGEITAYSVESSNVDLATEFSNMIVTQRAYSAATKIITTADEMLDELTRMT
ncbi:MAG: flagellar hook-basal body complex protein [Alphaproteobacteria bacterium]|jgi:fagellar hook-basal body proteins|uniref:flagellar hook-basal body complex protein n=1 Tax=Candidatus Scatocola faecigallinarum TaxID=2840916 RepID=UPI00033CBAA1|nr:flagellar hook protein FlgE [Azospirillum sp. CAG:239]